MQGGEGYSYLEEGMMTIEYQYYDVVCRSVCMCVHRRECTFLISMACVCVEILADGRSVTW